MNRNLHRLLTAAAVLLTVLAVLTGCGRESADEPLPDAGQADAPEIFIEESEQLPKESTPPVLNIRTSSGETFTATMGGYVWEWMNQNGNVEISESEEPCAADMKTISTIPRQSTDGTAELLIEGGTLRLVKQWVDGAPLEEGEKLVTEGSTIVFPQSGAYRYEVVVEYTGGRVYYAFMISE